jgi:hypothetical protein
LQNNKYIICLLPKSPLIKGRVGKNEKQDWYQLIVLTFKLAKKYGCKTLICSAFRPNSKLHETEYLKNILTKTLGANNKEVITINEGLETIGQLDSIFKFAKDQNLIPILVSTLFHAPRAWFICQRYKMPFKQAVSFRGMPRPWETITDIALIFAYPIIYWLGKEKWFLKKITKTRRGGSY